jgi:hypothetical protein
VRFHAPECSTKKLPLGALIVHLNDAHHWTRERIAAWVAASVDGYSARSAAHGSILVAWRAE